MTRPAVGAALRRCGECGGYEYSGAPGCATCQALVDDILEEEWRSFVLASGMVARDADIVAGDAGLGVERLLAEIVAAEPDRHDWRVVDAALDRLTCCACGERLGLGPVGCNMCDPAHGYRYAAIETDRPGVQPGNEHAIRVNVSVVRRPHVTSDNELLVRRMLLPLLLVGYLPSTAEAQRVSALIKQSPPEERIRLLEIENMVARLPHRTS